MPSLPSFEDLTRLYDAVQTIAVVGASNDESKQAHKVPLYLQSQGFRIVPVNPNEEEVLGEKAVRSLRDISDPVDAVDVFRPATEAPAIAEDAVALGAQVLWLQLGIVSEEASRIAADHGLTVVMDACMGAVHRKLQRDREPDHPPQDFQAEYKG